MLWSFVTTWQEDYSLSSKESPTFYRTIDLKMSKMLKMGFFAPMRIVENVANLLDIMHVGSKNAIFRYFDI
jgi:hypothetical protein